MPQARKDSSPKDAGRAGNREREERLAAALRENLRKRKAQQRGRVDSDRSAAGRPEKRNDDGDPA